MVDITKIKLNELEADLLETKNDIITCKNALRVGVSKYSGGSVQERLDINLKIEQLIEKEIERRTKCQLRV